MPRKKKKKQSAKHIKASLRNHEKQQQIVFYRSVKEVLSAIDADEVWDLLSDQNKRNLFITRFRKPKVVSLVELKIPNFILKTFQEGLDHIISTSTFTFSGSDKPFSMATYFTTTLTIKHWFRTCKKHETPFYHSIEKALQPILQISKGEKAPEVLFMTKLDTYYTMVSDPFRRIFYSTTDIITQYSTRPYAAIVFKLYFVFPRKKRFNLNGDLRNAYEMIFVFNGIFYGEIDQACFEPGQGKKRSMRSLYVQKHALDRLKERLDCLPFVMLYYFMANCFNEPEVIPYDKNKILISFHVFEYKLGYFVVDQVDDAALIRTFLFLTNDGTPEGKMLKKSLGMTKIDKQYNQLDKLSTFAFSDIKDDKELNALLKAANCESLLTLDKGMIKYLHEQHFAKTIPNAASIKEYFMIEESEVA